MMEQVIERARKLASSPLSKDALEIDVRWTPPEPPRISGADQLNLDAALRGIRQFLRETDPGSLRSIVGQLSADEDLDPGFRKDLARLLRQLDGNLDQPPPMRFKVRGQGAPTYREILEAILYGSLECVAEKRRAPLESWLAQPVTALLVRSQFQAALASVYSSVQRLRSLCERELLRAAS